VAAAMVRGLKLNYYGNTSRVYIYKIKLVKRLLCLEKYLLWVALRCEKCTEQ
jgi:hypothetical protein